MIVFITLVFSLGACSPGGPEPQIPLRFLALGDSYTIGQSVSEESRWPVQLAEVLSNRGILVDSSLIIARTGWRTDQLQDALEAEHLEPDWELVSLLIGVNNFFQGGSIDDYATAFTQLLDSAIALAGNRPGRVFVVSIPDYAYTPYRSTLSDPDAVSAGIDLFNDRSHSIAEAKNVAWFNITDISRRGLDEPELVASDGLHPSALQYTLWVEERLADGVEALLQ